MDCIKKLNTLLSFSLQSRSNQAYKTKNIVCRGHCLRGCQVNKVLWSPRSWHIVCIIPL